MPFRSLQWMSRTTDFFLCGAMDISLVSSDSDQRSEARHLRDGGGLGEDVADEIVRRGIGNLDAHDISRQSRSLIDIHDPVDFRSQSFVPAFEQEVRLFRGAIDQHLK